MLKKNVLFDQRSSIDQIYQCLLVKKKKKKNTYIIALKYFLKIVSCQI